MTSICNVTPDVLTVSVTQKHIDRGRFCNCTCCPIALAIADALPGADVSVGLHEVIMYTEPWHHAYLPHEARQFINDFDQGGRGAAKPLTFKLEFKIENQN